MYSDEKVLSFLDKNYNILQKYCRVVKRLCNYILLDEEIVTEHC